MKKLVALLMLLAAGTGVLQAQEMTTQNFNEWRIVTVVESIVPLMPIVLPVGGAILIFLLAFIAVFMS